MRLNYLNGHWQLGFWSVAAASVLALSGCQGGNGGQDFISDDPGAGTYGGGTFGDEGAGSTGDTNGDPAGEGGDEGGEDNGDGDVDISEADIVQMEGDRLYALSSYSGLTVVDMTNPDALRALGTWETDAEPFEMYVEDAQAFVMFNDYGFWEWDEGLDSWNYYSSSRLVALDASNPQDIAVEGEFTLPGRIQDSRRVGDVLYLVTMQDGYCWDCPAEQQTVVTSLDISNPAQPHIVDQLAFTSDDSSWDWQRSVASTTERMYVAARTWEWEGEGQGSYIDVIDISAGDGTLVLGDQVSVTGSVFSRWQMDEYDGILRVVSQLGWGELNPVIETFTIESSESIVPLGSGELNLPMPESLRSVRFDGVRAYAITAEQTDPLFTIDLSDPALPHQKGELEIPGWVYHMEARGDRVLALGFDAAHPDGSINVSLFDVSVFDQPVLRRRVHFGGDWASFAEDQNRIHKAFTILEDEQMILVPHSGWSYEGNNDCYGDYHSGVQIIDWQNDDLTLRGLVPSRGQARRAFTHRERIVTLSDVQIATFDYSDRDEPAARDELSIAVHVDELVRAGDVWVRMSRNWYTSEQVLEIVPADEPASPEPLGTIELDTMNGCEWSYVEKLFAIDDHVFVVENRDGYDLQGNYASKTQVLSIDISNPAAPVLVQTLVIPGLRGWGTGSIGGVSTESSLMVQQGNHLVFLMDDEAEGVNPQVIVVDVSNPAELEITATLDRPAGDVQGELSVMSNTVVSWHTEPVENQPGKVRFYFDRLELDGEPSWAPKVNVPGVIAAWNAEAGRAYTVDFAIYTANLSDSACYNHPKFWNYEYDNNGNSGTCQLVDRTLEQLAIQGDGAMLMRSIDIEGDFGLEQLYATNSRMFAKTGKWTEDDNNYTEESKLIVLDLDVANAAPVEIDGEEFGMWWRITTVMDDHVIVQGDYGELNFIDASVPTAPTVQQSSVPGWGSCYNPVVDGETVYCPMGPYGLETVDW